MRVHGIESNAFWTSRLTAALNWRFFIANAVSFLGFPAALIVEQLARNTNWLVLGALSLEELPQPLIFSRSYLACRAAETRSGF